MCHTVRCVNNSLTLSGLKTRTLERTKKRKKIQKNTVNFETGYMNYRAKSSISGSIDLKNDRVARPRICEMESDFLENEHFFACYP